MPGRVAAVSRLEAALAGLNSLDLEALRIRWHAIRGTAAPATFRADLLRAALAYTLQERALGGLKPATLRLLRTVAAKADQPGRKRGRGEALVSGPGSTPEPESAQEPRPIAAPRRQAPTRIKPGTKLLRTWQGTTHEVLVCDTGVVYRGRHHRSLSQVARLITGQRWSGPLFFGLKPSAPGSRHPPPSSSTRTDTPAVR